MSTLTVLQDVLVDEFSLRREQLEPDVELRQLGLDSLAVLEIMFKIEDRFGLNIKDDVPAFTTLNDVVEYIDTLLARKPGPVGSGNDPRKTVQ